MKKYGTGEIAIASLILTCEQGEMNLKVYRVINGEIDEHERDIKGPYYNNAPHIGSIKSKPHPKPKGPLKA